MARIKFSPIISEVRGKLGNVVFQGGKSGIVLREKVNPRNPRTVKQVISRGRLSGVKTSWQILSSDNRNSWLAFAQFFRKKTKNDQTRTISAYELFLQYNTIKTQGDFDILENTTLFTTSVDKFLVEMSLVPNVSLSLDVEVVSPDFTLISFVYLSKPFRASASIAKSEVRYMISQIGNIETVDITALYIATFNKLPETGQKILVKSIALAQASGWSTRFDYQEIFF